MRMRKVTAIGLFLNVLLCLNAGLLSKHPCDYRSLNLIESSVLDNPNLVDSDDKKMLRRRCYIESRQAKRLAPATGYDDDFLEEFTEGKLFDSCYGCYSTSNQEYGLVNKAVSQKGNFDCIPIWFIRQLIDDRYKENEKIKPLVDKMLLNFVLFWQSYRSISAVITGSGVKGDKTTNKTAYGCLGGVDEDADDNYLHYPSCFGEMFK